MIYRISVADVLREAERRKLGDKEVTALTQTRDNGCWTRTEGKEMGHILDLF